MIDFPAATAIPFEFALGGGLDTETPTRQKKPGWVIGSDGYEPKPEGGYERLGGIERFDGRASPSSAELTILHVAGNTTPFVSGNAVVGSPSGATGTAVWFEDEILALINVTGVFVTGDTLTVGGAYRGVATTEPSVMPEQTNAMYEAGANYLRALIQKVPGLDGTPVRGAAVLYGVLYAWRDYDALTQKVYKATASGWQEVALLQRIAFTGGTAAIVEGDTLSRGGVTATVRRVVVQAGDPDAWSMGTPASGWLIISSASGAFTAGAATSSGGGVCALSGTQTQIELAAGGRWELKLYNFYGGETKRIYGADGVNDLIEFDGTVLVPIPVDMPVKPKFIEIFESHLWASFATSIQRSAIQYPYAWTVILGSAELAMGDQVTGMKSVAGSETEAAMLVSSTNSSAAIYGDSASFRLAGLSTEVGAAPYTLQEIGKVVGLDTAGARDFTPTQAFGNFTSQTITDHIRRKATNLVARASVLSRRKGRYRLFLADGVMLTGAPGKRWAWMFSTLPFGVNVATEGEMDGVSRVFIGCDDGYVREMDAGRSMDGEAFEYWMKLPFSVLGVPGFVKKGAHITAEFSGASFGRIKAAVEVDYANPDRLDALTVSADIPPPATLWDIGNWDVGVWDGQAGQTTRLKVRWQGENVAVTFFGESAQELPHEISSASIWFRKLRQVR